MSDLKENKKILREEFRRRRTAFYNQLDNATRNLAFRRAPSPLKNILEEAETIGIYASRDSEAPTHRLIEHLSEMGKSIAFPVVVGAAPLEFRHVSNIKLLEAGFMGIAEPGDGCPLVIPDLIITPMIAFDRSMNRLGQGGGHFDRTFNKYPKATRIGLAWSIQETEKIPVESHDIALDAIVTETELIQKVDKTS